MTTAHLHDAAPDSAWRSGVSSDRRPRPLQNDLRRPGSLDATELAEFPNWATLADPEGNEFDLIRG